VLADSIQELPVPIVVKLSQAFYDRFGDEVVDELVGMLNQVDASSQQSLRELNEANFARFDERLGRGVAEFEAKMEQRIAALEAKFEQRIAALEAKFEQRFAALEVKFEQRFAALEIKFEQRIAGLEVKFEQRIAGLEVKFEQRFGALESKLSAQLLSHTRWMIGMWATMLLAILGLWLRH
jgi:DNA anti-recombination protein RmuC